LKDEVRDQVAHLTVAVLVVGPLVVAPSVFTAALTGFMLGLNREVGEERPPLSFMKLGRIFATQKFDLTFWTLGGAAAWFIFGA
jgi:hypothetical protein